jgi:hypothetical protein
MPTSVSLDLAVEGFLVSATIIFTLFSRCLRREKNASKLQEVPDPVAQRLQRK